MALERGKRASSVDRAADQWHKEALRYRETTINQRQIMELARGMILVALNHLAASGGGTHEARLKLLDTMEVLRNGQVKL